MFFGIDPGLSGYLAIIDGLEVSFHKCPASKTGPKGRNQNAPWDMFVLVSDKLNPGCFGYLEAITAHATSKSLTATFTMGGNFWLWRGLLDIEAVPYDIITAQKWQKGVGLPAKSHKDKHIEIATRLYPQAAVGRNHNKADALLLAHLAKKDALK